MRIYSPYRPTPKKSCAVFFNFFIVSFFTFTSLLSLNLPNVIGLAA